MQKLIVLCMMALGSCVAVKGQEKPPLKFIVTTPLPGFTGDLDHFGVDVQGGRLFLASEDQKTVEVFDLRTGKRTHSIRGFGQPLTMAYLMTRELVARWPLPDAHVAHAIALDEPNHRLFTASRKPAEFIVFNNDTGKVISTIPCVGVNSDMSLDVANKRIYVTGSETATVIEQRGADHYEHIAEVPTAYRAKSSIFVPELKTSVRRRFRQGKA